MVRSFGAADRNARARTLQEQQIQMAQDAADRENRVRAAQVAQNIAMETGYSLDGWGIDKEKLERDAARAAAGEDVPEFHAFSSGMANFEVENPEFSFKKAVPGPGGTITMAGSYDSGPKKGEVAPLTVNGTDASDDEVAYSDPRQAAALLINNYDSVMNDPALAEQKGRILRTKKLGSLSSKLTSIKGQLTAGVMQKLRSLNAEPRTIRAVKAQLAQLGTPQAQIAYLKDNVIPNMQEDLDAFLSKEQQQVVQQAESEPAPAPEQTPVDKAAEIKKLESRLANLEGKSGRGMADRRQGLRDQIAALKETPEEATAPKKTGQMARNNKPVPAPAQDLMTKAAQVSQEELEQGRGPTFTQEELSAFEEYLSSKGINSMAEAYKGTQEDIQALRAVLSQSLGDEAQRRRMFNEFNNVLQTGSPAYDQKTLTEAQQEQRKIENTEFSNETARLNSDRLRDDLMQKVAQDSGGAIGEASKRIRNVLYDKDGEPQSYDMKDVNAASFGPGGSISSIWNKFRVARDQLKRNPKNKVAAQKKAMFQRALYENLSLYMQIYNQSDEAEISVLATDSGAPLNASDDTMSRVKIQEVDGDGNPTVFWLINPSSGTQDGDAITASQVKTAMASEDLYDFFVESLRKFGRE